MRRNYLRTKSIFTPIMGSKRPHILRQIAQLFIVIFLLATITGTCQRTSKSNLKTKPNYVDLIIKPKIQLPPKCKSILSHLWLCDLISRSGDIHSNPGPQQAGPPNYPCGTCQRPVRNRDKAIICDECNLWHHISCVGISPSTYHSLINQTAASRHTHPHYRVTNTQCHILIVMNITMQYVMTMTSQLSDQTLKMHLPRTSEENPGKLT